MRALLGLDDQVDRDQDREHHEDRHRLGEHGRGGHQLAREPDLLDQLAVLHQRGRPELDPGLEEAPDREAGEHEQRVVRDVPGHPPEHGEDERVDAHHRERVDQRPEDAERRAPEARAQLAADERAQQLAVAREPAEGRQCGSGCGVDGHPGQDTGRSRANRRRRQPALAPAHRDRELHPRHGRGPRRGGRRRARAGRVRAVGAEGARADRGGARRARRRGADAADPTRAAHGLEPARPADGRAARRAGSTSSTSRTGCTRAQRRGLRATTIHDLVPLRFPEWVEPETLRLHGPKYENAAATCDRIFANSQLHRLGGGRAARRSGGTGRVAYPGIDPRFSPEGEAADLGGPYVLAVSTLEPRKNLPALVAAFAVLRERHPELTLALAGLEGWEQRAAGRRGRAPARLRLGRRARTALSRRVGLRLPVAVRGLRDPGRRGARERRSRGGLVASVAGRGERRASPCAPIRTTRRTSPRRSSRRSPIRAERASSTPRASPGGRAARRCWRGT